MATRENQAIQIVLILFVVLTFGFAATAYVFFQRSEDLDRRLAFKSEEILQEHRELMQAEETSDELTEIIGHPRHTDLFRIKQVHAVDSRHAPKPTVETVSYRDLVQVLSSTVHEITGRELDAKKAERALTEKLAGLQKQHQAEVEVYEQARDKLTEEMVQSRKIFGEDRETFVATTEELAKLLEEKRERIRDASIQLAQLQKDFSLRLATLQTKYRQATKALRKLQPDVADRPDGQIASINGRLRTVTLNLGSDDLLHPQVTFSVFSAETGIGRAKPKAKIEVLRISGPHSAEARILEDQLQDLILPGDLVYSPVWNRNQSRRFALVGKLDIDGDGISDRQRVHQLIRISGGIIDAELRDDGTQTGKMTVETRFLVMGSQPVVGTDSAAYVEAYGSMIEQGEQIFLEPLSLGRFLDLMGYVPRKKAQFYSRRNGLPKSRPRHSASGDAWTSF